MAVETGKMGADAAEVDKPADGAQQVILWDMILQRELVEQRRLRSCGFVGQASSAL